ncbi:MAG: J domain-containing protein [Bacteroides sp.]|nr:J domain-containing protein [Prevotella sp.]MCM1407949.1 J domain-containing protein [Treponema brennaborense]MCM1469691.1 J domain-containing protein [Bacteroides sp.]
MNSMFDRLGSFIRTYIEEEDDIFSPNKETEKTSRQKEHAKSQFRTAAADFSSSARKQHIRSNMKQNTKVFTFKNDPPPRRIPVELYNDFFKLGLTPGASMESCKSAHKMLLKQYHPDRHVNDPEELVRANEMAAIINASFQRIATWFKTGKLE